MGRKPEVVLRSIKAFLPFLKLIFIYSRNLQVSSLGNRTSGRT